MSDEFLKQMRAAEQDIRTRAATLGVEVDADIHTGMVDMRCGQKRWSFRGLLTAQIALEVAAEVRQDHHLDLLPKHAASCSNQNVLNPVGKYVGAADCGCQEFAVPEDLQQRVQPFGLLLVRFPDGRVRVGSPGRYITFSNRDDASRAIDLLEQVAHRPRTEPLPTGTTEITYPTPNSVSDAGGM